MSNAILHNWESISIIPMLAPDTLHLWYLELNGNYREELNICSITEKARAASFKSSQAQANFLHIRTQLRRILGSYLNVAPKDLTFNYGPQGKPQISWPQTQLKFNLTHSNNLCLIAINWYNEIGIDIELVRHRSNILAIAQRMFNTAIVTDLTALSETDRLQQFYIYWTSFEAQIKAHGNSLFTPQQMFIPNSQSFNNTAAINNINFIPAMNFQACIATLGPMPNQNQWRTFKFTI